MKKLGRSSIFEQIRGQITTANYSSEKIIEGLKTAELTNHIEEDGDLSEVLKLNGNGVIANFPNFKLAQINRVRQYPGTVKAWHLHFAQDEIWYVSPFENLFVGLWDIRKDSKTEKVVMRIILGGGKSELLFIPRGVAHGSANFTNSPVNLYCFLNRHFDLKKPDEMRLPWDILGKEFWQPTKD